MAREGDSFEARDFGWLVAASLFFFMLVAIAVWSEVHTGWAPFQIQFRELLGHYGRPEDARSFQVQIRQIWIPKIGATDRCITCHLGYEYATVLPATVPEPLTPHPRRQWLGKHEFASFGCTTCHGGQGWATTTSDAHVGGRGWDEPMLSPALARQYGLTMGEMMQMRCNFCHRHDTETAGMDEINRAKKLFKQRKCLVCHAVEGRGGVSGPELTFEGDQNPELYDFSRVKGPKTFFNWNVQHLVRSSAISPNTQMPDYAMPEADARALTLLLLSWRHLNYPPEYIPVPRGESATSSFPASPAAALQKK